MTKLQLLEELKLFTEQELSALRLPVRPRKTQLSPPPLRAPGVHIMGLSDVSAAKEEAPYVLHQVITGRDIQPPREAPESRAEVRSIFAVYHQNRREGQLALLECIERLRIGILRRQTLGKQFILDIHAGVEYLIYPEDIYPFYAGEMLTTWKLPPVEREVNYYDKETEDFN